MKQKYITTKTTVSLINYHFIFCPRYRRKIFLDKEIEKRFKVIVKDICTTLSIKVIAMECDKDHAHIFVRSIPKISPSDIMAKIKGITSRKLRKEFVNLNHLKSLWTRSFFVSTTGRVSGETIKNYVEQQKKRG